jgi:hypothetical protein
MKVADPYLMSQDHVNQQPSADQYVIGGPSEFAEDVHPSNTTWEAEYAGGQVKRNEIGMPEMRSDTFNHPEKTASEEVITKKAALCVAIARKILPKTASAAEIEDQSYSFMHLPDSELMSTYTRLASQDDLEGDQSQQKQIQSAQQDQDQQQGQQVQAAQQQDQQGQQVQAGKIPPQFLENVNKKKEEAEGKKDQGEDKKAQAQQDQGQQDQGQQKQAQQGQQDQGQQDQGQQDQGQQKQAEMQQQISQLVQQAQQLQQQLAQNQQQQQAQMQQQQSGQQQQQAQMQQQSQAQQVAQAVQQAMQQGQDPVQAAQQCMAQYQQQGQSQQQSNNEIDQMLADQGQIQPMADMDIQLDTPSMDVGEIQLSPDEDDTLRQLFASNPEYKNAQEASGQGQDDQGQQAQQKQAHVVRTASMRTVGTRPTAGVSQIGGVPSSAGSGRDLSSIWNSAPDVREVFGMRTDQ